MEKLTAQEIEKAMIEKRHLWRAFLNPEQPSEVDIECPKTPDEVFEDGWIAGIEWYQSIIAKN